MKNLISAVCFCLILCQNTLAQKPSDADYEWVNEHFQTVLDKLLPVEAIGKSVGYRSYRDLYTDELEYSFVISRVQRDSITGVIRVADSVSLYDQMMSLHLKYPNASIKVVSQQLKIKEWKLSEESCPAMKRQYNEFYQLSLPMLSARERAEQAKGIITVPQGHPQVHIFETHNFGGEVKLTLYEEDHPFVLWAIRTRRALEICDTKQTRN